jgi:NADH dehydrogenase
MADLNIPKTNSLRVVIIGGGFAGLNLAKSLKRKGMQVVMLDKHNYHTFQPLLYQVATAGLEPDSIAYPIRNIFRSFPNFYFRMAKAEKIDAHNKILHTDIGILNFDKLVIATGSETNYFGMDEIEKMSMPMKTVPEALDLRSLILQNFEAASLTTDLKERERLMNFVIVGGGPTGTELAGALAELKSHVLPNDYPDLDFRGMSIHLVEMAGKVLPPMSESSSKHALDYLKKLGVQVWLNTAVKGYNGKTVSTDKSQLPASTLIWAAGVKGSVIPGLVEKEDFDRGRYVVNEVNQVGKHEDIFALGDVAGMNTKAYPKGHPMLAQVAIQQGQNLAKNLVRLEKKLKLKPFSYNDLGSMATVGRNKAVVELYNKIMLKGFAGWAVWMLVHLLSLVGFRNRLVVLLNWFVNYFSYDRKIRLIIRPFENLRLKKR